MRVFVLLFNARTDNEGIYSMKIADRDLILMFEQEDDAIRFADQLEAEDFLVPTVEEMDREEIEEFCQNSGYNCELIDTSMLVMPLSENLEQTDWQADDKDKSDRTAESIDFDLMRKRLEGLL
jgi:hypothetical protein